MNKVIFITISVCLTFIIITAFIFLQTAENNKNNQLPAPTPSPVSTIPKTENIQISNVPVKNFYKGAEINKENDAYFLNEPNKYQIMYFQQFNNFTISIVGSPFEETRQEAEKAFIQKLQISEADACNLNVQITTPYYINPDYSGKTYKLSFCQ